MSQGTSRRRARARSGSARVAGHRARPPARGWTEERVREELRSFLAGRGEWPSYREFQRAGRKGLRDAVTQLGGAPRWARELGVLYVERSPGHAPIWTEERIRADLAGFLAGHGLWPTRIEFEAAGCKALRDAVGRTGGPPRWAAEFGLPRRDERRGSRRVWTDCTRSAPSTVAGPASASSRRWARASSTAPPAATAGWRVGSAS